jgi:hypothetical protein
VVALHDIVAVPEFVTLAGLIAPHVSPVETVSVMLTDPVNLLRAVIVIVDAPETPV